MTKQTRFHNRKVVLSQNVTVVVRFDMRFHYVLTGWKENATKLRVSYPTIDHSKDPFAIPKVKKRKYYLADGGYPNIVGLLIPYRGHHYHMLEFSTPGVTSPQIVEELFNHRHSSL
ncbi:hypothetical protein EJ110_NYTH04710 [Nymphaea thermarum]|nr:hypothetical protein EJ110_NYTH04710 [Nymphaea thermarum]